MVLCAEHLLYARGGKGGVGISRQTSIPVGEEEEETPPLPPPPKGGGRMGWGLQTRHKHLCSSPFPWRPLPPPGRGPHRHHSPQWDPRPLMVGRGCCSAPQARRRGDSSPALRACGATSLGGAGRERTSEGCGLSEAAACCAGLATRGWPVSGFRGARRGAGSCPWARAALQARGSGLESHPRRLIEVA